MCLVLRFSDLNVSVDPASVPEPHIRTLGLAVLRGPTITVLNPVDGLEEIANPFLAPEQ